METIARYYKNDRYYIIVYDLERDKTYVIDEENPSNTKMIGINFTYPLLDIIYELLNVESFVCIEQYYATALIGEIDGTTWNDDEKESIKKLLEELKEWEG